MMNLYNSAAIHRRSDEAEAPEGTLRHQQKVKRCVFRRHVNCEVVVADLTGVGRLFQVVAAATANARSDANRQ